MAESGDDNAAYSASNAQARTELTNLIRSGASILFAGAGCSVSAGFPTWPALLVRLEELCEARGDGFAVDVETRKNDPLGYADRLQDFLREPDGSLNRYCAELFELFHGPPKLEQFQRDLVALPVRGFVTTNYDGALESALAEIEPTPPEKSLILAAHHPRLSADFLHGLNRIDTPRKVAHLHGHYTMPQNIVLSQRDYTQAYGPKDGAQQPTALRGFVSAILANWSLVFVGFSFSDPMLINFLQAATDQYHMWGAQNHFALVETTGSSTNADLTKAAWLKEKFATRTVFYDNEDHSHRNLKEFISALRGQLVLRRQASFVEINDRMAEGMRG